MKSFSFPDMPVDVVEMCLRTDDLGPTQFGIYMRLRQTLWRKGGLPSTDAQLATIAGVSMRSWFRMRPILAALFEVDADGSWHDPELEEQRAVELEKLVNRKKAGAESARQRRDKQAPEGAFASTPVRTPVEAEQADAGVLPELLLEHASSGRGSIDRSLPFEDTIEIDRSIDPATAGAARESQPFAATTAGTDGRHIADFAAAKPAGGHAKNHDAVAAPVRTPAATACAAAADETAIIDELRGVCGSKVADTLLTPEGIRPLLLLVSEGCSFELDIKPVLRDRLPALEKPLRSFRAEFLTKAIREYRKERERRAASTAVRAPPDTVFVRADTPEWRPLASRWKEERGKAPPTDNQNGWHFPRDWLPLHSLQSSRPHLKLAHNIAAAELLQEIREAEAAGLGV